MTSVGFKLLFGKMVNSDFVSDRLVQSMLWQQAPNLTSCFGVCWLYLQLLFKPKIYFPFLLLCPCGSARITFWLAHHPNSKTKDNRATIVWNISGHRNKGKSYTASKWFCPRIALSTLLTFHWQSMSHGLTQCHVSRESAILPQAEKTGMPKYL